MGHRLGAVQKLDRGSECGIYDVEERFLHPIDRALTLLLLDRENFGSMIQSGWRVGGLVALLGALLVTSLRRGGEKVLMPWGWRTEWQRGLRLYLQFRRRCGSCFAIYATATPAVAGAVAAAALLPFLMELRLGQQFPPRSHTQSFDLRG